MLVAISGRKRSGKDTVAKYLCEYHGYEKAQPFAVFKYALAQWFGWDERHLEGALKEVVDEEFGFSPRQIMQLFGQELMKEDLGNRIPLYKDTVGDSIWAKVFCKWYEKQDPDKKYVVSDLRFLEEATELSNYDDVVYVQVTRETSAINDSHASESYFDKLPKDVVITNNNTLEALYDAIDKVVEDYTL